MPDTEFRIKATGVDATKQSFKQVQDSFKQMEALTSKFNRQGPFSPKDLDKAARTLKTFHSEYLNGLKVLQNYQKELSGIQRKIADVTKEQQKYAQGSREFREQARILTQLERRRGTVETGRERAMEAMTTAPGTAQTLEKQVDISEQQGKFAALGTIGRTALGALGLTGAIGIVRSSLNAAGSTNANLLEMAASMNESTDSISELVEQIQSGRGRLGMGLGFSAQEISSLGATMGKTGVLGGRNAGTDVILNTLAFQRQFGISPNSMVDIMGVSARGGRAGGVFTPEQAGTVMAEAIGSGLRKGRFDEFIEGVAGLTQTMQDQGAIFTDPTRIGSLMAAVGQSGSPILQGARGAQVLATLNQSLVSPGGGIAGQLANLDIAGFGRGGTSWWSAQKTLAGGLTQDVFLRMMSQARAFGPEGAEMMLSMVRGIKPTAAAELLKPLDMGPGFKPQFVEDRVRRMSQSQFQDFARTQGLLSPADTIQNTQDMLKDMGLSPALTAMTVRAVAANTLEETGQAMLLTVDNIAGNIQTIANFFGGHGSASGAAHAAANLNPANIIANYLKSLLNSSPQK